MRGKLHVDDFDMRVVNFLTGWARDARNRPEATLFVVASLPRSGTHMLSSLLDGHPEIRTEAEIFNPYSERNRRHKGQSAEWLLRNRAWYDGPQRIRGVPIHLSHDDPWSVWQYLRGLAGIRYLCMRRRNVLEQFVSHEQAMVHGRWQVWQDQHRPKVVQLSIDPRRLEQFARRMETCWERFDDEFASLQHMTVWYEQLCEHTEAVSIEVQRFLGASVVSGLRPGTIKVGRPLSEVVSNYDQLRRYFRGSKYEECFESAHPNQIRRAA
jgi:LPS sulfotransferase NodH